MKLGTSAIVLMILSGKLIGEPWLEGDGFNINLYITGNLVAVKENIKVESNLLSLLSGTQSNY